jgi:hypothetical protein
VQPYKHSGRFTPIGLVIALAAVLVAAVPLGWVYTWLMMVTDYIKLRALEAICFGAVVGVVAGYALRASKVRNNTLAAGIGAVGALLAHYVGWAFFIERMVALSGHTVRAIDVGLNPAAMWRVIVIFNQYGTWTEQNSSPTTGVVLWAIWAAEALTVIVVAAFVSYAISDNKPFCETCGRWAEAEKPLLFQAALVPNEFKSLLLAADAGALSRIPRATAKQPHYKVEMHHCSSCHNLNTVSVALGGTRNNKELLAKTLLQPDQADRLRGLGSAVAATASK